MGPPQIGRIDGAELLADGGAQPAFIHQGRNARPQWAARGRDAAGGGLTPD